MFKLVSILYISLWEICAITKMFVHVVRAFPIRKESVGGLPKTPQHSLARPGAHSAACMHNSDPRARNLAAS